MKKILRKLLPAVGLCLFALPANAAYYLIGAAVDGDSWSNFNEMTSSGSNTYVWSGSTLGSGFKITAQPNWNGTNYGSNTPISSLNSSLTLSSSGGDIAFGGELKDKVINNPTVTLTVSGNTLSITLTGSLVSAPTETEALGDYVYIIGNITNWTMSDEYKVPKSEDGIYKGSIIFPALQDNYFRIYSNIDYGMNAYSYGPPSQVQINTNSTFSGTANYGETNNCWFLSDWTGGTVNITFNANTHQVQFEMTQGTVYPDAMYLVGNFNKWTASDPNYILTKQSDNTYVGTYNLPATIDGGDYDGQYPEFKVFGFSWMGPNNTTANEAVVLESGVPNTQTMTTDQAAKNWYLDKWDGGEINFSVDYENNTLTLLYNEPTPDYLYVVGSFTDNDVSENYKLAYEGDNFWAATFTNIPAADQLSFRIKYNNTFYGASEGDNVIDITPGYENELEFVKGGTTNWVINNWRGGDLMLTFALDDDILVAEYTAPAYILGEFNDWTASDQYRMTLAKGIYSFTADLNTADSFKVQYNFEDYGTNLEKPYVYLNINEDTQIFNGESTLNGNAWVLGSNPGQINISFNPNANNITMSYEQETTIPENLYLVGDFNYLNGAPINNSWDYAAPLTFTKEEAGVFTVKGIQTERDISAFFFYNMTGESYDALSPFYCRYIPSGPSVITPNEEYFFKPEVFDYGLAYTLPIGVYDITVDFSNNSVIATPSEVELVGPQKPTSAPENLYIVGDISGLDWDIENAIEATKVEDGIFSFTNIKLQPKDEGEYAKAYFSLINTLSSDWDEINDGEHRYGPYNDGSQIYEDGQMTFQIYSVENSSWSIFGGVYNITVNFNNSTIQVFNSTDETQQYNIYVYDQTGWENLYLYMWGYEESAGTWPGSELTQTVTVNDVDYLNLSFEAIPNSLENLIFHQNIEESEGGLRILFDRNIFTQDLYLQLTLDGAEIIDPETFVPVVPPTMVDYNVYVYNSTNWDNVYLYVNNENNVEYAGTMPGITTQEVETVNSNDYLVFNITLPEGSVQNLTFSNGEGVVLNALDNVEFTNNVYVQITLDGAEIIDPETFVPVVPPTMVDYNIYVYNSVEWDNVYLWIDGTGELAGAWPGIQFTETQTVYEVEYLVTPITLEEGSTENLIFNNGDGEQLDSLSNTFNGDLYVQLTVEGVEIINPETFVPTVGVNSIMVGNDTVIYTLQGVRVDANKLTKGLYIINGKKVLVK